MSPSKPSREEIGHCQHRQELSSELYSVVEEFVGKHDWDVINGHHRLDSFDGRLLEHTIHEQTIQSFWELRDGRWIQIDVASTGDAWDALVIFTSSGPYDSVIVPQGRGSAQAKATLKTILNEIADS